MDLTFTDKDFFKFVSIIKQQDAVCFCVRAQCTQSSLYTFSVCSFFRVSRMTNESGKLIVIIS